MSRAQRLLELIQILRANRRPVTGANLASQLNISLRTLYRDIATLQEQGANIQGEAGMGYLLRPGYLLPPLMFSDDEIEALVLGSRWVASRGEAGLGNAARSALAKIGAVLPVELNDALNETGVLAGPAGSSSDVPGDGNDEQIDLSLIRQAIRQENKLIISYRTPDGVSTTRTVWPVAIGYFDHCRVLVAWCELRDSFRHFRTDRISAMDVLNQRYPQWRRTLLKAWRESEISAHRSKKQQQQQQQQQAQQAQQLQ